MKDGKLQSGDRVPNDCTPVHNCPTIATDTDPIQFDITPNLLRGKLLSATNVAEAKDIIKDVCEVFGEYGRLLKLNLEKIPGEPSAFSVGPSSGCGFAGSGKYSCGFGIQYFPVFLPQDGHYQIVVYKSTSCSNDLSDTRNRDLSKATPEVIFEHLDEGTGATDNVEVMFPFVVTAGTKIGEGAECTSTVTQIWKY